MHQFTSGTLKWHEALPYNYCLSKKVQKDRHSEVIWKYLIHDKKRNWAENGIDVHEKLIRLFLFFNIYLAEFITFKV